MRYALLAGTSAIVGLVIGALYGLDHAGPLLSLGTWGIAGLVFGAASARWKLSIAAGTTFGFTVSLFFLIGGYQGARPVYSALPFFVLLGVFGAVCGAALGAIGWLARRQLLRR